MIKKIVSILTFSLIIAGCDNERYDVSCSDGTTYKDVKAYTYNDGYMHIRSRSNGDTLAKLPMSLGCKAIMIDPK